MRVSIKVCFNKLNYILIKLSSKIHNDIRRKEVTITLFSGQTNPSHQGKLVFLCQLYKNNTKVYFEGFFTKT